MPGSRRAEQFFSSGKSRNICPIVSSHSHVLTSLRPSTWDSCNLKIGKSRATHGESCATLSQSSHRNCLHCNAVRLCRESPCESNFGDDHQSVFYYPDGCGTDDVDRDRGERQAQHGSAVEPHARQRELLASLRVADSLSFPKPNRRLYASHKSTYEPNGDDYRYFYCRSDRGFYFQLYDCCAAAADSSDYHQQVHHAGRGRLASNRERHSDE